MTTSETINELAGALALAQAEMKNATLNKVNPHFRNKYADLGAVRSATLPALNKHGLSILQTTQITEAGLVLVTRLAHKSGQWMDSTYPLPLAADKPQVMGSALTYARRYAWSSLCGVFADEDDDAEAASAPKANGNGNGHAMPPAMDHGADPAATINASEIAALRAKIVATGADLPKFLAFMRVDRIEEIPVGQLAKAKHALDQKAKVTA